MKRLVILQKFRRPALLVSAGTALLACWVVGGGPATAEQSPLTLSEAVRLALENNTDLRAFAARVDGAASRANQAGKWSNPDLELSAEEWPLNRGRGFSDSKQTIGIAQTLPYPGKKSLDRRVGTAGVKISEAELALRRTEVVRDTKAGFWRVLACERLVEVSRELVQVADSSASTARKRVDAGAAAYQEQLRAEVQLEQARTELAEFERDLDTARHSLAQVLGKPELSHVKLSGVLPEAADQELLTLKPDSARDLALDTHPAAIAAKGNIDRAHLEQRRARLEPYPDPRASVAGGRYGEEDKSIIELGLSLPLPILDRSKGKQQEARANVAAAEAEMQSVRHRLQTEWAKAQHRYQTALEQVTNYRQRLLPKAAEALRLVQIGFEEGKFGFIDLVDTQRTTAEARLTYQQKLLEMNVAQAELEALLRPQTIHAVAKREN